MDKLIILDPGHGGKDPGATREGVLEKDINLNVALLVGKILNPGLARRGYRIGYIRATDMTVELTERPKLAAIEKPNIYVSIHCNAVINPKACGIETWYPQYSIRSKTLAKAIQDKAVAVTGAKSRGIKEVSDDHDIYVLRKATYPAALIEMGFLSNPTERRLLTDSAYQQSLASAIAEGINAYFRMA